MSAQHILIVDDEPSIREVVRLYLQREGFSIDAAADGATALEAANARRPDLVVLDLMLPGLDGFEVYRRLRSLGVPVIMLTAKGAENDRIAGLEMGADDYVVKPFSPRELVARVKTVLRRVSLISPADASASPLVYDELHIDPRARTVEARGRAVTLTAKEFDLLWLLATHPAQVFTRTQVLDRVWGRDFFGDASTVTVHIRRLREKIERDPSHPRFIATVWGVGYKFEAG
ncbi:MAG TPA: response regulator transcription factor [Candidatus Acidoferrales bacterium]|jgi:DNA-binding response OmpR family regulator|nr:response regulator transcription factor [Candidatus Acidoferrales bacterium]